MAFAGLAGGANAAITASAIAVDLSALGGKTVLIWCAEQDIVFSFAETAANTTLVTGAQAASLTALVADNAGAGIKIPRRVTTQFPFLIVATATGSGTLRVKPVDSI